MIKYIIQYEDEELNNDKTSTCEYKECEVDDQIFDSLEKAQQEFDKFESYIIDDSYVAKHYLRRIATLYKAEYNEDNEIVNLEQLDAK